MEAVAGVFAGLSIVLVILMLIFFAMIINALLVVIPFWKIFSKAGYAGAWALLMLIPLANIVIPFFLGFSHWPLEKELEQLKNKQGNAI